jgi:hypothetical protein
MFKRKTLDFQGLVIGKYRPKTEPRRKVTINKISEH